MVGYLPDFLLRFFVFFLRATDNVGWMPKSVEKVSPFHSSLFFTNVGSIGTSSIYHHLYEFGTCTFFVAMGRGKIVTNVAPGGEISTKRIMSLKFVMDERVCDGHYYSTGFASFASDIMFPEKLLVPPEKVCYYDGGV